MSCILVDAGKLGYKKISCTKFTTTAKNISVPFCTVYGTERPFLRARSPKKHPNACRTRWIKMSTWAKLTKRIFEKLSQSTLMINFKFESKVWTNEFYVQNEISNRLVKFKNIFLQPRRAWYGDWRCAYEGLARIHHILRVLFCKIVIPYHAI